MAEQTITLSLADDEAEEAATHGLLEPHAIESLLREELRRRRVGGLFEAADRLACLDAPPLTDAEIKAEIRAARGLRVASDAGRS